MAHNVGVDFLLEKILENLKVLKRQPEAAAVEEKEMTKKILHAARGGWHILPSPVQAALKPALYPFLNSVRRPVSVDDSTLLSSGIDLEESKCFPHNNGSLVSGIRVNLSGREPAGLIEPGEELNDFCRQLTGDLTDIVDRITRRPMVKRVMRTSDLFQGEYIAHLPDLLVEWNKDIRIGSKTVRDDASCQVQVISDKIGLVDGEYTYCRTGGHRPEGLFAVLGAGIRPGTVGRTVSIMDFAPTFLDWFGLANDDLDGRPLEEVTGFQTALQLRNTGARGVA